MGRFSYTEPLVELVEGIDRSGDDLVIRIVRRCVLSERLAKGAPHRSHFCSVTLEEGRTSVTLITEFIGDIL
jgi:hypothetical protein